MWQDSDLEQIRKFLGLSADGTNQIELKQRELLMTSPQSVLTARSYIERVKVLAELIDDATGSNAGATKIVSSTGEIHEFPEGEPFDTLRAEARRYIGLLADLIDLPPRVDYFHPVTEFNAVPGGGVRSFKGRSGVVTPEPGDYEIGDVTGLASALAARALTTHEHPEIIELLEDVTGVEGFQTHMDDNNNPHQVTAAQVGAASVTDLALHLVDSGNPHSVTAAQVGAASTAALSSHTGNTSNPHSVTAAQVGASPTGHTHSDLQAQSDLLDDIISAFAAATEGQVIAKQGTALAYATAAGGGGGEWLEVTSDRTCQAGDKLYVDTATGSITLTLPSAGDVIVVPVIASANNGVALLCNGADKIEDSYGGRFLTLSNRFFTVFKVSSGWKIPTVEGYNGTPGWMPSALSQNTAYGSFTGTLRNLTNGVNTDGALTNGGSPAFIRYDLGTARECNRVTVGGGTFTAWGSVAGTLNGAKLQSSTDDSTWTDRVTFSGVVDSGAWLQTFTFSAATARYWRISGSDYISTSEFTVWKG